jgi:hypothetical protein
MNPKVLQFIVLIGDIFLTVVFLLQQMAPAKQAMVMREFQKQSAQMDMTVRLSLYF